MKIGKNSQITANKIKFVNKHMKIYSTSLVVREM